MCDICDIEVLINYVSQDTPPSVKGMDEGTVEIVENPSTLVYHLLALNSKRNRCITFLILDLPLREMIDKVRLQSL